MTTTAAASCHGDTQSTMGGTRSIRRAPNGRRPASAAVAAAAVIDVFLIYFDFFFHVLMTLHDWLATNVGRVVFSLSSDHCVIRHGGSFVGLFPIVTAICKCGEKSAAGSETA